MRIFIIIVMILSLLIMPWTVYGAAAATIGVAGAVAALLSYYGISVVSSGATSTDISTAIYDMLGSYAAYKGSSVATLFPTWL